MLPILRLNSAGPEVAHLQRALASAGCRVATDGHFGHATEAAVRVFQKKRALLPDGIAGQATLRALEEAPTPASSTPAGLEQAPSMAGIALALAELAASVGPAVLPSAISALHRLAEMITSRPPTAMSMSVAGTAFLFSL